MTTQLAFGALSCGAPRSTTYASTARGSRPVCIRKSGVGASVAHDLVADRTPSVSARRRGPSEQFGRLGSPAMRVETALAVAVLIGLAAVESYFIAQAALNLQAPPKPRAPVVAADAAPSARQDARFSPESSRLAMLATVGGYLASALGGDR